MKFYTIIFILLLFTPTLSKTLSVAVFGKTGVGKSSLINSLFGRGKTLAPVGHDEATTMDVSKYETVVDQDAIEIWDTMGVYDDIGNPKEYIKRMSEKIEKTDLILFCLDASEPRWTRDNKEILELFKNELDNSIFKNTLFIFTKFNVFRNKETLMNRQYKIKSIIPSAKFGIAESDETKDWQKKLWNLILDTAKENSKPIFIKIIHRSNNICEISKNATNNIIENDVFPIYMDKQRTKEIKDCMSGVETFNDRINTVSLVGTTFMFVNVGPILKVSKLVAGSLGIGGGLYIKNFVSNFHRNASYCDKVDNNLNIDSYHDTYEWTGGTYKGLFKRNLFHGYGELWDHEDNHLFKGTFKNGNPEFC
jgi:tRNA U34 5-carboxymethylaminomethyl modifying GTPase MnmE/TrmE